MRMIRVGAALLGLMVVARAGAAHAQAGAPPPPQAPTVTVATYQPRPMVRLTGASFVVAPGGAAIVANGQLPRLVLGVAPADSPLRAGQKDGEFTAVIVERDPEVVLWVRSADLVPVITQPAYLAPTAKAVGAARKPDAPGVTLGVGLPVKVLDKAATAVRVRFQNEALGVDGWVPLASLGTVYLAGRPPAYSPPKTDALTLPARSSVLVSPGGATLVTINRPKGSADMVEVKQGLESKEHVHVEWSFEGVTVVGWVPKRSLEKAGDGGMVGGVVGGTLGGPLGGQPGAEPVAAGTAILDRPGGVVIGRFAKPGEVVVLEKKDGLRRFQLWTDVGWLTLWLAAPAAPVKR